MKQFEKEELLKLTSWVNLNCQSIGNRKSLFEYGINPDKLGELYRAARKLQTGKEIVK